MGQRRRPTAKFQSDFAVSHAVAIQALLRQIEEALNQNGRNEEREKTFFADPRHARSLLDSGLPENKKDDAFDALLREMSKLKGER